MKTIPFAIIAKLRHAYTMEELVQIQMDIDYPIPSFYFEIDRDTLKTDLQLIRDKLSDNGMDGIYWSLFRQAFNILFQENNDCTISYRQFEYLETLRENLITLKEISEEKLLTTLVSLNFNDPAYVRYTIEWIRKETDVIPGSKDKLIRLSYLRKVIRQSYNRNIIYQVLLPSLGTQIEKWIKERMTQLETEPQTLTLADLHPETAQFLFYTRQLKMSRRQLDQFLNIVMDKKFYRQDKEKIDYLYTTFCDLSEEDNPNLDRFFISLKIIVTINRIRSFLRL